MNKDLIDLQRNSKATCVIIKTEEYNKLSPVVSMKASVSNKFLLSGDKPPFADKINEKSANSSICYFVITDIDEVSIDMQNRFEGLVKDRELKGYTLPDNCIIVFTVKDKFSLKNISTNLYHFMVVSI